MSSKMRDALLSLEADSLRGCGIPLGPTLRILKLVYDLKVSKSHGKWDLDFVFVKAPLSPCFASYCWSRPDNPKLSRCLSNTQTRTGKNASMILLWPCGPKQLRSTNLMGKNLVEGPSLGILIRYILVRQLLREILASQVSIGKMFSHVYTPLFHSVIITPKPIPDEVLESLYQYLCKLTRGLGLITSGKEAKRLHYITLIIVHINDLFDDMNILVEEPVPGQSLHLNGHFEFILQWGAKKVCIIEAKKGDMD